MLINQYNQQIFVELPITLWFIEYKIIRTEMDSTASEK